jgi:HD-GYP domain-containing protein (c-di-GMP phosphodiesterase class II)
MSIITESTSGLSGLIDYSIPKWDGKPEEIPSMRAIIRKPFSERVMPGYDSLPLLLPPEYLQLKIIAQMVELEMPEIISHGYEVSVGVQEMMRLTGRSPEEVEHARVGAIFHDAGKVRVKDLVRKPGPFTQEERIQVHAHPVFGEYVLLECGASAELVEKIIDPIVYHHENYLVVAAPPYWQGFENEHDSGYPFRLHGEQIPHSARCTRFVDVYCGLRAERPYKEPWSMEKSLQLIKDGLSKEFDPELYHAFLASIPVIEAALAYTSAAVKVDTLLQEKALGEH